MKRLLNTLYITKPNIYLGLDGENITLLEDAKVFARFPLHNFENIMVFGYQGVSPALMKKCVEKDILLSFFNPHSGRFMARVMGETSGNIVLRKKQYQIALNDTLSLAVARNFIIGKLHNSRWVLERLLRDHQIRVNVDLIQKAIVQTKDCLNEVRLVDSLEGLRGYEGKASVAYFGVLNEMILNQKLDFEFKERSRRPPLDRVNCMLSFAYSLLANEARGALEGVGLDSYAGFMHQDRSGRASLALDLMEELRAILADRFIVSLINRKQVKADDFIIKENGAVEMVDEFRREFIKLWQDKKQEKLKHPFLEENIQWGLVAHAQAMLLARFIRGGLDEYPPFLWK